MLTLTERSTGVAAVNEQRGIPPLFCSISTGSYENTCACREILRLENWIPVYNLLAAGRVHVDLKPIHVAEVGLVVAEGFDACEVGHALPRAVQQRLVDAKVVRVAMDAGNGFAERDHLGAKRDQEVMEAVRRLQVNDEI